MSLDDNKHALYQLLAHPKYDNSLSINAYVKFIVSNLMYRQCILLGIFTYWLILLPFELIQDFSNLSLANMNFASIQCVLIFHVFHILLAVQCKRYIYMKDTDMKDSYLKFNPGFMYLNNWNILLLK